MKNIKKEFTKDDFKTGMTIKTRNGELFTIFRDVESVYLTDTRLNLIMVNQEGSSWYWLSNFRNDLTIDDYDNSADIMEIYKPYHPYSFQNPKYDFDKAELLWKRDDRKEMTKEMTLSEIENELGYKIKIVNNKKDGE